jgi:hypothetical protein
VRGWISSCGFSSASDINTKHAGCSASAAYIHAAFDLKVEKGSGVENNTGCFVKIACESFFVGALDFSKRESTLLSSA